MPRPAVSQAPSGPRRRTLEVLREVPACGPYLTPCRTWKVLLWSFCLWDEWLALGRALALSCHVVSHWWRKVDSASSCACPFMFFSKQNQRPVQGVCAHPSRQREEQPDPHRGGPAGRAAGQARAAGARLPHGEPAAGAGAVWQHLPPVPS